MRAATRQPHRSPPIDVLIDSAHVCSLHPVSPFTGLRCHDESAGEAGTMTFSRQPNLEAARPVCQRWVSVVQAARDLDIHENVLREWFKRSDDEPHQALSAIA
jgi:hypothetical protein